MIRFLAYRVGLTLPLLLGTAVVIFLAGHYAPGDPVQVLLGDRYTPEAAAHMRHDLGLDRPFVVQLAAYIVHAAAFDFGVSYVNPARRVRDIVRQTLPISVRLAACAVLLATILGVTLGVGAAVYLGVIAGLSVPSFVTAAILVLLFALRWRLLPVAGWGSPQAAVLPVIVLAAAPLAYITRISRASVRQVMTEDYVRTARSKGLRAPAVLLRHVLRNAALPIVTTVGMAFGYAITGAFVVEVIFNIPGMARVAVDAILQRDYTIIQTAVLVYTTLFVVINLVVDLSYAFLNPRVRY
ncbi:MAG: ABC transporter permease [Bacillati bacterium ANGP1]|uniref:ABC transporter permease n=1 Tax=Candidatus Segetimicrobium genomatis TaxID=2569760 RepID=A0A537LJF7_9BACT|nr:MAG: ABC transporter permease [Terrabacteria group bacterium ANGP1]